MKFTPEEVKTCLAGMQVLNSRQAQYSYASQVGITGKEIDLALGDAEGTFDLWASGQGLEPLKPLPEPEAEEQAPA